MISNTYVLLDLSLLTETPCKEDGEPDPLDKKAEIKPRSCSKSGAGRATVLSKKNKKKY